jgi:iron complex transport system substrate-binding protein
VDRELERIASNVVDAALRLHMRLGPGLIESVYEMLLADEMVQRGFPTERQKRVPLVFDGRTFERAFRVDLLVAGQLIVEVKSVDALAPTHWKQLWTYLRLMDLRLGLLINFGEARLKDGLKRVVNRYDGFGP